MRGRWLLAGAAAISMLGVLGGLPALMVLGSAAAPSDSAGYTCSTPPPAAPAALTAPAGDVSATVPGRGTVTLDADQLGYAKTIIDTGLNLKIPERGWIVAIATALQESTLQNLTWGDRDSVGLFQQRRAGWGTFKQRTDPATSARMFYKGGFDGAPGLMDIGGWQLMPVSVAAQRVQVSAFPSAYAKWEGLATKAVAVLSGDVPMEPAPTCEPVPVEPSVAPGEFPVGDIAAIDKASNGQIPPSLLAAVPWAKGHRLRPDALNELVPLDAAFKAKFGEHLCITDSYRSLDAQYDVYARKPGLAAKPGTSNHGLARALDLCGINGGQWVAHAVYDVWMHEHAPAYGWGHPAWAEPGGSRPESWHWSWRTDN